MINSFRVKDLFEQKSHTKRTHWHFFLIIFYMLIEMWMNVGKGEMEKYELYFKPLYIC